MAKERVSRRRSVQLAVRISKPLADEFAIYCERHRSSKADVIERVLRALIAEDAKRIK